MYENDTDLPISAAEYLKRPVPECEPFPDDELARAVKAQFRGDANYLANVYGRFRRVPIEDAIKAVRLGYSSPAHAASEGAIAEYRKVS